MDPLAVRASTDPEPLPVYVVAPACAASLGLASGLITGSKYAGLQYLAENAHRQPRTALLTGSDKTKNYRMMWGGIRRGTRSALRLGGWTAAFLCLSEGLQRAAVSPFEDRLRDAAGRLFVPSGVPEATGAASAGALAILGHRLYASIRRRSALTTADQLPRGGSKRRYGYALLLGLVTGGVQDLQAQVRRWKEPQREV